MHFQKPCQCGASGFEGEQDKHTAASEALRQQQLEDERPDEWWAEGPQRKILREGTYAINTTQFAVITWYINRLFATAEAVPKTIVRRQCRRRRLLYGTQTADVSGEVYRHGELVVNGSRGVCRVRKASKRAAASFPWRC